MRHYTEISLQALSAAVITGLMLWTLSFFMINPDIAYQIIRTF